jgi:hypothetical protein
VSGPVFKFCAPGLVLGSTAGIGSRFNFLRALTHFRRYQGRRLPFSCFARPDSFPTVPRASYPVFKFCDSGHVFGGTKGVGSCFHVLRSTSRFSRYRGRRVPFSCFVLTDTFLAVPRALSPLF